MQQRIWHSLRAAFRGLGHIFRSEPNFRIQLFMGLAVLLLACFFPLKNWEVILLILLVMAVLVMEILNSSFEYLSDLLKPRLNYYVQIIKDIMAGAVLLVSLGAVIVGLIIFLPYFIQIWK